MNTREKKRQERSQYDRSPDNGKYEWSVEGLTIRANTRSEAIAKFKAMGVDAHSEYLERLPNDDG